MAAINTAVDGMVGAIREQAEKDGWSLRYEYDDVVWFKLQKPYTEESDFEVLVEIDRKGKLQCEGDKLQLSNVLKTMFKALAILMPEFWSQYEKDKR